MCIFVNLYFRVFFIIYNFIQFISENKNDFLNSNYELNQEILNLKKELNLKNQIINQQQSKITNLQNQLNNKNNITNNYHINIQNPSFNLYNK